MNSIKCSTKIINILIILYTLLIITKGEIFNNPLLISENANPIMIRGTNGYYYIFTSGQSYILDSNGEIIETNPFISYSNPYTWINDQFNNHYIFTQNEYIKVTFLGTFISYNSQTKPTATGMEYTDSYMNIGSMSETKNDGSLFPGCLCPIAVNEVIIYGKKSTYNLVLTFLKKKVSYPFVIGATSIEHKIECRVIQNGQYLCAIAHGYAVHIYLFSHVSVGNGQCEMKNTLHSTLNNAMTKIVAKKFFVRKIEQHLI